MAAALIIFVATYLFLAGAELPFLKLDRPGGAVAGAVAMVAFGVLTPEQVYQDAISWDTLVLLLGMMVITSVMARAAIFRWVAWIALRRAHGPRALLAVLVLVSAALSALLVNDTVCVMCTPLVIALVEAAELPALPYLLGLAFASNAGSVATLTGNPQNMLIGTLSGISYLQFSKALLLPGLLSTLSVLAVLLIAFRRELAWKRFTVAACQLVSNVPFVLLAAHWVPKLADPHLSWLSLALVSTLAGNLTPVASVANLIVLELAGSKGKIPFLRFLWLGALCTFIPLALGLACLLLERPWL